MASMASGPRLLIMFGALAIGGAAASQPTALPPIPAAPRASLPAYPGCADQHVIVRGNVERAAKVRSCITLLEDYNNNLLQVFRRRMEEYRNTIWNLWGQVNRGPFSTQQKREFHRRMNTEFVNALEDGSYMDNYHATHGRYRADTDYLRTQFCNLVSCRRNRL